MTLRSVDAITMDGFKCFDHLRMELGQLTLVTGFNGGGKSTAIQPLLLLAQTLRLGILTALPLNGPMVKLGTAGDITPNEDGSLTNLTIEGQGTTISVKPKLRSGDRVLQLVESLSGALDTPLACSLSMLSYLGAIRIGPEDSFPIPEQFDTPDVGLDGRFAPYWYDHHVDEDVDEARRFPGEEASVYRKHLDAWLGSMFPGAQANVQNVVNLSQMNLQFRLSSLGAWRRPSNIGYGLTYVFPILVSLLSAKPGQIIIIDSPESHLHPSAQRILATFAQAGVQILVETHSDHLLNGVRLAIREQVLPSDCLRVHFFRGPKGRDHGVTTPSFGAGGEVYEWPDGFFDQNEKDLSRLAGWA